MRVTKTLVQAIEDLDSKLSETPFEHLAPRLAEREELLQRLSSQITQNPQERAELLRAFRDLEKRNLELSARLRAMRQDIFLEAQRAEHQLRHLESLQSANAHPPSAPLINRLG